MAKARESVTPPELLSAMLAERKPPRILIIGGGYAGFYTAWKLEKLLRRGEAQVTLVDPLPYMTYQPFLPEVAAGSIEPRHAVVSLRRHLKRTKVITGKISKVNHEKQFATVSLAGGHFEDLPYDQVVITAGAITRTFPIAGVADVAIGMKTIEEAVDVRNRLIGNFERAESLPAGPERQRLLTTVVVGGGFAGIETFAELRSAATYLLRHFPGISFDEVQFHLIEAMGRIMPEVSQRTSEWVIKNLARRNAKIHLNTQLTSAEKGNLQLSNGETLVTDLVIWTAGAAANPVARATDLPTDDRGRITVEPTLRVVSGAAPLSGAWAAGDVAAVPDLTGGGVGGFCVPNAQHAVRQGKLLASNLVSVLRGESPRAYAHKSLGTVAGLGLGIGAFQFRNLGITGFPAWVMHRGYHGLAVPTWERKLRVFSGWILNWVLRRDLIGIEATKHPRLFFASHAARTKQ